MTEMKTLNYKKLAITAVAVAQLLFLENNH